MFSLTKPMRYGDIAHLLLRLVVAAVFINHGLQKLGMWSGAPDVMSATMVNIMKLLSIAEPLAGVALIIGLLTRFANVGLMIVMLSAFVMKITRGSPMNSWEIDAILFIVNLVLFLEGPGRYSLDATMSKR